MAEHYVDNQRFLGELIEYQKERKQAKTDGIESPPCPEYIGECFLKIANRLSYRPNFINYAFRWIISFRAVKKNSKTHFLCSHSDHFS